MADILQFRPRLNVFARELTSAMGNAYDKAIASLPDNQAELAVRLARRGERNPEHLSSSALSGFKNPPTAA